MGWRLQQREGGGSREGADIPAAPIRKNSPHHQLVPAPPPGAQLHHKVRFARTWSRGSARMAPKQRWGKRADVESGGHGCGASEGNESSLTCLPARVSEYKPRIYSIAQRHGCVSSCISPLLDTMLNILLHLSCFHASVLVFILIADENVRDGKKRNRSSRHVSAMSQIQSMDCGERVDDAKPFVVDIHVVYVQVLQRRQGGKACKTLQV